MAQLQYLDPPGAVEDNKAAQYQFPATLPPGYMGLSGTWTIHAQEATAGAGAELELGFLAKDVYLVMGGSGTVEVSINGHHTQTIAVGGIPGCTRCIRPARPNWVSCSCASRPASRPMISPSGE